MTLSERLAFWYGLPEYRPSEADMEIESIIDGVVDLEQEIEQLREVILHAVATIENEHDPDLVRPWLVGHVLSGLRDALLKECE